MSQATFLIGDVRERMAQLPDQSFDLILCSPPFLALRSYLPDGHPDKAKEIGSESTPAEFLDVLLELTAEWGRLLAPHGSIAIELGDTYAGSGGAGGDYNQDGLRAGQPTFRQSRVAAAERVNQALAKSLMAIPQLYQVAITYGINPLTGQPSPAGRWRVRNLKPWIRSNPPVGYLGDKERPATSYVIVATRAVDRYFDLDAVRTTPTSRPQRRFANEWGQRGGDEKAIKYGDNYLTDEPTTFANAAGAPPRDWYHTIDAILDNELALRRQSPPTHARTKGTQARSGKSADRGGNWSSLPEVEQLDSDNTTGAQGVHLRRALEKAGILTTLEALDISPRGYNGAHYAVWPPELVRLLVDEMCPRRVCTTCGQPSRRIVRSEQNKTAEFTRQPELAAHIKERREALGITSAEINRWFGYKEIAKNWERTDKHGAAIPNPDDWPILKERLGLSDEWDGLVLGDRRWTWTDSTVEYDAGDHILAPGERRETYDRGGTAPDRSASRIKANRVAPQEWSDCGHGTWRPGAILDPFVGSGTTLTVTTGMARDATGIDIDERNAHLALERVGMFLTVDHGDRERSA